MGESRVSCGTPCRCKKQVGEYLNHPDGPKQYNHQIIMRLVNRQDLDRVWMNKEKIKNSKNYSLAFHSRFSKGDS